MSKYEPKFGRVLIEREIAEKTSGGIILPGDTAKKHAPCVGRIVALGETAGFTDTYYEDENQSLVPKTIQTFKVGDKVLFGRYSGAWLDANYTDKGEVREEGKLFICQDQDILAVIKE